jgi:plastocyanin
MFNQPSRRFLVALLLALAVLGLTACGDDSSDDGDSQGADTEDTTPEEPPPPPDDAVDLTGVSAVTVEVGDNKYTERAIIVSPGTEITWENVGLNRHNVVPSTPDAFEEIPLDVLDDGGSDSRTFSDPGDYAYYCSIHGSITSGQRGWVVVADA